MDALKQWALCLIIAAIACTFVMAMSPRGATDKTVRAVAGIFVVAAICSPLAEMLQTDLSADAVASFGYDSGGDENMRSYMLEMYRAELETQILSEAKEHSLEVKKIYISVDVDADNCIIIHEITVTLDAEYMAEKDEFSRVLSEQYGFEVTVNAE